MVRARHSLTVIAAPHSSYPPAPVIAAQVAKIDALRASRRLKSELK